MEEPRAQIALLIDADNSQSSKIDDILAEVAKYGECNIRRAYGNWKKEALKGWEGVLHEKAIKPVQQFDYSKGKNASDMALVIDAMALLYTLKPDGFAIVSSDADFTPLVQHLKENGARVYGFGQRKTPEPFTSACTRFLFVEALGDDVVEEPAEEKPARTRKSTAKATTTKKAAAKKTAEKSAEKAPEKAAERSGSTTRRTTSELRQDAKLVKLLRDTVTNAADDDGWATVSTVGQRITNRSSFDTRNYGYATLTKLLKASELFDFKDEGTGSIAVRDVRHAD
ncbi:NYN domain-containing protein [Alteromonas gracilis]